MTVILLTNIYEFSLLPQQDLFMLRQGIILQMDLQIIPVVKPWIQTICSVYYMTFESKYLVLQSEISYINEKSPIYLTMYFILNTMTITETFFMFY